MGPVSAILSHKGLWSLILALCLTGCRTETYQEFGGETMGTSYKVQYLSSKDSSGLQAETARVLEAIDVSVSTYIDTSVISRINNASDADTWHPVDLHFERIFRRSQEIYGDTNGAFNPAAGPLIDAWGFGSPAAESAPDETTIRTLLKLTPFEAFQIESHPARVRKPHPGSRLNFNAIGEGYGVDAIAAILEAEGVQHYLVEIGGEVRARGRHSGDRMWKVGIARPSSDALAPSEVRYVIALQDGALATSGNYRNYRILDGKRISHIVNPATGYPEDSNLLSVSVLASDATTADAYATALMVKGLEEGLRFVEAHAGLEALFFSIGPNGEITETRSSGFPSPQDGI
jgi:thiamine biosynthesis lipoprotein